MFVYVLGDEDYFNKFKVSINVDDTSMLNIFLYIEKQICFYLIKNYQNLSEFIFLLAPIYQEANDNSQELLDEINRLLEMGVIQYANENIQWSNSADVKIINDEWQLCVDYGELNERTYEKDYNVPTIQDTLNNIPVDQYIFTKIVLKDGFYQLLIRDNFRHMTAFNTGRCFNKSVL